MLFLLHPRGASRMNKADNEGMVASSLAAVVRQSLDSAFKKECYLLLGVTNSVEVQDAICFMLESTDTREKLKLMESASSCSSSTTIMPKETVQESDSTGQSSLNNSPELPEDDFICVSQNTTITSLPSDQNADIQETQLHSEAPNLVQDISDDETQLDWDNDIIPGLLHVVP